MKKILAIQIIDGGYEKVIYINADKVKVTEICSSIDELDQSEKQMFGNTTLGKEFAVFDWESLD
jgi:hypothetical protein